MNKGQRLAADVINGLNRIKSGCKCRIVEDGMVDSISFCPMHQAAPELLAECRRLLGLFDRARVPGEITQTSEGIEQLRAVVAKATA